jgi:hypothetical protein
MVPTNSTAPQSGAPTRQLLVVAACAVGLLIAAVAMPASAPQPPPPDLLNDDADCRILFSEEPVAGHEVTVTVEYDGEPATDAPVWFNDDLVGRTDGDGQVSGQVPYEQILQVRVGLPGTSDCEASTETGGRVTAPESVDRSQAGLATLDVAAQQQAGNRSGEYPVGGRINIAVDEQPYPGETTTLRATIQGQPVPGAAVTVDGQAVGETDADGRITIRAPIEGDGTLRVQVTRGDFQSRTQVVVLRLGTTVETDATLPLPGQGGTVVARLGDRPAVNATVLLDDERLGSTGANGTLGLTLPSDPTAQVTVATADQVTSVPILLAFAPTILAAFFGLLILVGVPALGYHLGGRRGMAVGWGVVANVYTLSYVYLRFGPSVALLGALALLAVVGLVAFVRSDYSATSVAGSTGGWLRRLGRRLVGDTLWLSGQVVSAVDGLEGRLRRLQRRLTRPDATPVADARHWIASLPGRLLALVLGLTRAPFGLFRDDDSGPDEISPETDASHDGPDSPRSRRAQFRQVWREFAGQVVPTTWPRRTAGEVSRRAIERGFSPEPVRELTDTFRAVEYGDESLTERQIERARAALDAIRSESDEEGSP